MKIIFLADAQTEFYCQVLVYTRAAASDYDDWENMYGNKGWGSEYLIPLLKKVWSFTTYLSTSELTYGYL